MGKRTILAHCFDTASCAALSAARNALHIGRLVLFAFLDLAGFPTGKPGSATGDYQMHEPYPEQVNVSNPPGGKREDHLHIASKKHPTVS